MAGTCPTATGNPATLDNGLGSTLSLTLPKFNQFGNVQEGSPTPNHIFVLTGVTMALDWKMLGNVNIYNFSSSAIPYNYAKASATMTLNAGGTTVMANGVASTGPGVAGAGSFPPLTVTNFSSVPGSGSASNPVANLAYFEGFGANNFSASLITDAIGVSGQSSSPMSGFLAYNGTGQMGAIMTLTYNYTEQPVPEPGTLALMGGALIGLGCFVRRKRMSNR